MKAGGIVAREIIMEIGAHDTEGIQLDDEDFRKNADAQVKELEQLVRSRFWGAVAPDPAEGQ